MLTEDKLTQLMCKVDRELGGNKSNQEIFDFIESAVLRKLEVFKETMSHTPCKLQGCFVEFATNEIIYSSCALEDGTFCTYAEDLNQYPGASKHQCKYWGDVSSELERYVKKP